MREIHVSDLINSASFKDFSLRMCSRAKEYKRDLRSVLEKFFFREMINLKFHRTCKFNFVACKCIIGSCNWIKIKSSRHFD